MSACAGKRKMATEALAKERAETIMRVRSNGARRINYYQCRACGCWHLTSWSPEKYERVRAENRAARMILQAGQTDRVPRGDAPVSHNQARRTVKTGDPPK